MPQPLYLDLRREEQARQARFEHEELIRKQIEEKKRIEQQKRKLDEEEPWWVRQDRKKAEAQKLTQG